MYDPNMPKRRRNYCLNCGACRDNVPISKSGLCPDCGKNAHKQATAELRAKRGPVFEAWVDGILNPRAPNGRPITAYPPDA